MTLSTDATSGLSDALWPGVPCIPGVSVCESWLVDSPASSLTSSQPCSPGGRPQQGGLACMDKDALDLASTFSHGYGMQPRNKRARIELNARVQVYGHVEGASRQIVTPPVNYEAMVADLQPPFSWSQVAPHLPSAYAGGSSSSSGDHFGPSALSHCSTEKTAARFVCLAPSDGSLSSNSTGTLEQATSTTTASWQPHAMLAACSAAEQTDATQQYGLATTGLCRAAVVRAVVTQQPCGDASHADQQPGPHPVVLGQSHPSVTSSIQSWTSTTGICPSSGLVVPFIFTAAPAAGPTTVLTAAQLGVQSQSLSCPLPTAWSGPSVFSALSAQACLQQPVLVSGPVGDTQLGQHPQLCVPPALAPQLFTPRLSGLSNAQPPCTIMDAQPAQPQLQLLPLLQPQPQHLVALNKALPAGQAQSQSRVRPPSPAPPGSPVRQLLPNASGPEDWILHVIKVLGMAEPDTAPLALHCWRRIAGLPQLHHATRNLPSAVAGRSLYATACVWVSIKLEEKRRAAPGGVVLSHMASSTPAALCSAELAVMNWLSWRPYDGYTPDESHLLVYM